MEESSGIPRAIEQIGFVRKALVVGRPVRRIIEGEVA